MSIIKKLCLSFLLPVTLAGCKEKLTYSYFMQHPIELRQAMLDCETMNEKTHEQARQCEVVMYAAANMLSIVSEQQEDPEKFGQHILDAETAYATAVQALQSAQQTLIDLQHKSASAADLEAAKITIDKMQKAVQEKQTDIKVMLGVLSLSSPE